MFKQNNIHGWAILHAISVNYSTIVSKIPWMKYNVFILPEWEQYYYFTDSHSTFQHKTARHHPTPPPPPPLSLSLSLSLSLCASSSQQ